MDGNNAEGAAGAEIAAARRLVHELAHGAVDRQVLFRFYVAGEDTEKLRADLGLDAAQVGRIHARALQRFKEILRSDPASPIDLAAGLRRGLTGLAAREAAGEVVVRQGLLTRLGSPAATVALIVLLLAALATAGLLELRAHRLRKALDSARITAPPPALVPAAVLAAQLRETRRVLDGERLRSAERLEKERRQREQLVEELERERRPQINTPLLPLEHDPSPPARPHRLSLPPNHVWMVLSLDLEGIAAAPSYTATLQAPGGIRLWNSAGLTPSPWRSLAISLPSTLLKPGDYQIQVDAVPLKGAPVPAGRYSFRVVRGAG